MHFGYMRFVLIVSLAGIAGAVVWYYLFQKQVNTGKLSLSSMFWLVAAVAIGVKAALLMFYAVGARW